MPAFVCLCRGLDAHKDLYLRSKVGLNMHYYSGLTVLEVHRLVPMVANGVLVVTARSNDSWYDTRWQDIATFADGPQDMAAKVQQLLQLSPENHEVLASARLSLLAARFNFTQAVMHSGLVEHVPCHQA